MKELKKWLTLNLQHFADDAGGADGGSDNPDPGQSGDPGNPDDAGAGAGGGAGDAGTFTDDQIKSLLEHEQIQKYFQSEADKIRTAYAQKLKSKEDELEAIKVEKMTAAQKAEYELSKRETQLKDKESAILKQQIEIAATNSLVAQDIPLSFSPFVLSETPEKTTEKVEQLKALWQDEIDKEVQKRFAANGKTPPRSNGQQTAEISMNDLIRRSARR